MGLAEMLAAQWGQQGLPSWRSTQASWQGVDDPAWRSAPQFNPVPQTMPQMRGYQPGAMRFAAGRSAAMPMTPEPQAFDRAQPVNLLEHQLAMRQMMQARGRGLRAGNGYVNAQPVGVPTPVIMPRTAMPVPQRTPVMGSIYGGR